MSSSTCYVQDNWTIQEQLPSRWHQLVACILLNQSRRTPQWDETLWTLFGKWPTPSSLASADSSLEQLLVPHGMSNVKAKRLRRMSEEFQTWDGKDVRDLYGCGQYAYDSYRIFVGGERPQSVNDGPLNSFLDRWHAGWRFGDPMPAFTTMYNRGGKHQKN